MLIFKFFIYIFNYKKYYMATTYKFKVSVSIKTKTGSSQTIHPIIEAATSTEAKRIAEAQYPNGSYFSVTKIS